MHDLSILSSDHSSAGPLSFMTIGSSVTSASTATSNSASSASSDFQTLLQAAQKQSHRHAPKSRHAAASAKSSDKPTPPNASTTVSSTGSPATDPSADPSSPESSDSQSQSATPPAPGDPAASIVGTVPVPIPAAALATGASASQGDSATAESQAQSPSAPANGNPQSQAAIMPASSQSTPDAGAQGADSTKAAANAPASAAGQPQDLQAQIQAANPEAGDSPPVIGSPKSGATSSHAKHITKGNAVSADPASSPAQASDPATTPAQPASPAVPAGLTAALPTALHQSNSDAGPVASNASAPVVTGSADSRTLSATSADSARAAQDSPPPRPEPALDQIVLGLRTKLDPQNAKAEIRLEPPNLGTLRVSVALDHGTLTAHFQTSTDVVRDLLSSHLDKLRSVLEGQGIPVDKLAVQTVAAPVPAAADGSGANGTNPDGHFGNSYGQNFQQPQRQDNPDAGDAFTTSADATRSSLAFAGPAAPLDLVA